MTDRLDFETRLGERLRARAALASRPFDAAAIARQAVVVDRRGRWTARLDRPSTRPALSWLVVALLLAIALLGAVVAVGGLLREQDQAPARVTVVKQVIDAVNHRDVESLRSSFAADGIVEFPGVDGRSGREGNVYLHDQLMYEDGAPEGWMRILDQWGLEAQLGSCRTQSESTVICPVRTRWHVLQVEIGEEWTFDFYGDRVRRLNTMARVDPDPSDRLLPLGLSDLERWATWLRDTHPEQADRLLPKGPDVFAHYYFRFWGPPDEIGASIREYVASTLLLGPDPVSVERMTVIRQQVDAINAKDADIFVDTFIPEAVFGPGGDFRESSSLFGNSLPLADADLVEAWMAINRAWGFEAEILECNQDPEAAIVYGYGEGQGDPIVVSCEVAIRWRSLSTEITERWNYEFHGSGLGHWGFELLDLSPRERALPLGYDGLEQWESWLVATDPDSAARYLNPRTVPDCDGCSEWQDSLAPGDPERAAELARLLSTAANDWSIQGHDFAPFGLVPYDPAFADEIKASIQEYLDSR
jgi:hypothetical protein